MPDTEELLRQRLAREADRFAPSPGFGARTQAAVARSRRAGVRRGLSVAVAIALVGVAAVVVPAALDDDGDAADERIVVEPGPPTSTPASAEATTSLPAVPTTMAPPPPAPTTEPVSTNPGWRLLDPGPLTAREGIASAWTGTELIVWGGAIPDTPTVLDDGAAYDAATGRWRMLPPGPLAGRRDHVMVWTGREVVVWGVGGSGQRALNDGAAYDPATGRWRALPDSPLAGGPPNTGYNEPGYSAVWTGDEMLIWGGADSEGTAYDPAEDRWRTLPPAPTELDFSETFWTGDAMLVAGGTITNNEDFTNLRSDVIVLAYDPMQDSWRQAPGSGFSGQSIDAAWDGDRLVVLSYQPPFIASYSPAADRWNGGPRWGGRPCEGVPRAAALRRGAVLGEICGSWGLIEDTAVEEVPTPFDAAGGLPDRPFSSEAEASTGGELLLYDSGYPPGVNNPGGTPATLLVFTP